MSENKPVTPKPLPFKNLLEYLRSDEGKQRLKKAREEYQKKHPKK